MVHNAWLLGASKNQGPRYRLQIVGLLLQRHPPEGSKIYRNSHVSELPKSFNFSNTLNHREVLTTCEGIFLISARLEALR